MKVDRSKVDCRGLGSSLPFSIVCKAIVALLLGNDAVQKKS